MQGKKTGGDRVNDDQEAGLGLVVKKLEEYT